MNHPTTRLIDPSKNDIGRISKHILDELKRRLVSKLSANEWKNMISVIKWFKNINKKKLYKFETMQSDIKDIYPSIKEILLHEAIQSVKELVPITRKDIEVNFIHENQFYRTTEILGRRKWVVVLMLLCERMMGGSV